MCIRNKKGGTFTLSHPFLCDEKSLQKAGEKYRRSILDEVLVNTLARYREISNLQIFVACL